MEDPFDKQFEIMTDPHRFRVVDCGRRWGKTNLAMKEAWNMMFQRYQKTGERQRGWVVAPTIPLVRESWLTAEILLKDYIVNKKENPIMTMNFGDVGFLEFKSADRDDEGLKGAGLDCCVIDEAALVSRKAWEYGLRPCLSDKIGKAIFISTPRGRNWFYEMYLRGQDSDDTEVMSWKYPTDTNPYFPDSEWISIQARTPEMILKQEYMADFLEDEGSVFHNLESCFRGELEGHNIEGESYTIGVDLAKTEDFTVITVMRNSDCQLVNIHRSKDRDWSLQKKFIKSIHKIYVQSIVHVDATGLGSPIEEDLRKSGVVVRPYKFTNQSKIALVEQLVVAIEQGLIGIPKVPQTDFLIEELKAFTYERTPMGNIRYNAPEGLHDDGVISLGLAVKGMAHALYRNAVNKQGGPPRNSPAWLERQARDQEIRQNNQLPRRYRKQIAELSLS